MALPDFNKLVIARLEGTSHHTGDQIGWRREGWAFMVRWTDETNTVADGWARDRYERALKEIDADYARVVEWVYVSDLPTLASFQRGLVGGRAAQCAERLTDLYGAVAAFLSRTDFWLSIARNGPILPAEYDTVMEAMDRARPLATSLRAAEEES